MRIVPPCEFSIEVDCATPFFFLLYFHSQSTIGAGDFAIEVGRNIIHGSDAPESAAKEIALWFGEGALNEWTPSLRPWLYE